MVAPVDTAAAIVDTAAAVAEAPAAEEAAVDENAPATIGKAMDVQFFVDNLWVLIAAFLVFIMHLGFATVESGLTQSKNTVNILFKNTLTPCIGLVLYAIVGFNLMYPGDAWIFGKWFGFAGFGIAGDPSDLANATRAYGLHTYTYWTDFLFQGMFAATAATIVSGAVAERIKLSAYLLFTVLYVGLVYPFAGSWHWGAGWLADMGFKDFAGSTLVHSVGGWGALTGVALLGPRLGKYSGNRINPILPHNMPLATIGVFLLWFGWFGFNGGSVLSADPAMISYVCVTTSIAAAMGGIAAAMTSWSVMKKPDLSMTLNGVLAGLVGITANADIASITGSFIIGIVAGILVFVSVVFFDKIKMDDPVGALSVHLVNGIWGTLAAGIPFLMLPEKAANFGVQALGVVAYGALCLVASTIIWLVLKYTVGLRVSDEEEVLGLDLGEHGVGAYPYFQNTNVHF
ncbi:MAG: ammonium transporter [Fibrobacteria bacterium]|nr:ammonium transporter [Fibrobacteria bacterium]